MSLSGLIAGGYPDGAFDYSDSLAVGDPLPGLLSDPAADRRFLLRATPLSGGSPVAVDLTTGSAGERGYRSLPTDSPHKQFGPGVVNPYNAGVSLPAPDYMGMASVEVGAAGGAIKIANGDAAHDALTDYDWLGDNLETYLGPGAPGAAYSLFTRIARATAAGISFDLDALTLLYRDRRLLLQRALNETKYRGMGACLRGDGSNDEVTGTVACPAGSMTMMHWARPLALSGGTTRVTMNWRPAAGGAGERRLQILGTTDKWRAVVANDAGGFFAADASAALVLGRWDHIALVLDTAAAKLRLYVNGVLEQESTINGTFATTVTDFKLMALAGVSANYFNGEVDEPRAYSAALTQAQIVADMNREILASAANLTQYWKLNEGSGSTAGNEVGGGPSLTISGATWVGSLEGDASITGKPKPRLYGQKRQFDPVLVDPQRLVYQLNDGPIEAVDAVRDSGDPLSFGSDVADIYGATPAAGTYNTCLAKGLLRLNAAPLGPLTVDARGDNSGALGYVSTVAGVVRKMFGLILSDPSDFETLTFDALDDLSSAVVGYYSGSGIVTIDAAADRVLRSAAAWGALDRQGKARVGRVPNPATTTATFDLTTSSFREPAEGGVFRCDPARVPVKEVVVRYRLYQRTLSDTEVAGAVSNADRQDFGLPWREVSSVSSVASADGDVMTVETELDTYEDARTLADYLLGFWERPPRLLNVSLTGGVLQYFFGDVGRLTLSRYGMSGGKKLAVVGFAENFGDHATTDDVVLSALLEP
jgi:hypothetical protein